MWDIFPTYLKQVWNYAITEAGKLQIVSGEIRENEPIPPIRYDKVIAEMTDSLLAEERAKLIANAPNMFRLLCNIAGEVEYGIALLPEFLMEGINGVMHDIAKRE